jgi:hypothetical protein
VGKLLFIFLRNIGRIRKPYPHHPQKAASLSRRNKCLRQIGVGISLTYCICGSSLRLANFGGFSCPRSAAENTGLSGIRNKIGIGGRRKLSSRGFLRAARFLYLSGTVWSIPCSPRSSCAWFQPLGLGPATSQNRSLGASPKTT